MNNEIKKKIKKLFAKIEGGLVVGQILKEKKMNSRLRNFSPCRSRKRSLSPVKKHKTFVVKCYDFPKMIVKKTSHT